jgi:hypothetical protein
MPFVERNCVLNLPSRIENANFTGAETRATLSVIDCLTLLQEHRLNARSFESFPPAGYGLISSTVIASASSSLASPG